MGRKLRRGAIILAVVAVVVAIAGYSVRLFIDGAGPSTVAERCTVGAYSIDTDQASVAATMVGVVITRGLPERAAVLALAAGLQESKLRNLASGDGDRDSVGVLQQRPSQGWGTVAQLSDVSYATGAFLNALVKHPTWSTDPLATAIQQVQISADGSAYAPHEPEAQALADALTGTKPAALSCRFPVPTEVASVAKVAALISTELPVTTPTTSDHSVTVPGASWASAAWFVANADRLGIDSVAYSQQRWTRAQGWRADATVAASEVVATMHATS